jgi:hypothetical protein
MHPFRVGQAGRQQVKALCRRVENVGIDDHLEHRRPPLALDLV